MLVSAASWMLVPAATALGFLAIAANSMELFFIAVLLLWCATLTAFILTIFISYAWLEAAMLVLWSIQDGETGPWSSRTRHAVVWLAIFTIQVFGAGSIAMLSWSLFPKYPAGWP